MGRNSERLKTLKELGEMLGLKGEIEAFLKSPCFDETKAWELIEKVNNKHSENIFYTKWLLTKFRQITQAKYAYNLLSIDGSSRIHCGKIFTQM